MAEERINQEIKWLEEQLEAKKRALAEGESSKEGKKEKEIVRDILEEAQSQNLLPPPPVPTISDDDAQKAASDLKEKEHEVVINELIATAFSKGIAFAMKVANSLRNPHILDEFHDTLADKYYEKLLAARKVK